MKMSGNIGKNSSNEFELVHNEVISFVLYEIKQYQVVALIILFPFKSIDDMLQINLEKIKAC